MVMDLPDPLKALPPEEVACHNDMLSVGMQPGEAEALPIRMIATIVTASIISAWFDYSKMQRKLLFFAHWSSGLVYLVSEWVMATMILACWSNKKMSGFIKMWKFIELTADNMLAATNLVICLQLSLIVSSAYSMTPVQTLGSTKVVLFMLAVSALIPTTAVPLWQKELVTTGTQYWLNSGATRSSDAWVTISQFLPELCVACIMLSIVITLLATRRSELRKCWTAHWRIKYYFGLSCIAIAVNLATGVGGLLWIVWRRDTRFIVVGWSMRHVHVALDTLVLYGVLVKRSHGGGEKTVTANAEGNRDVDAGPAFELSNNTPATQTLNDNNNCNKAAAPTPEPDLESDVVGAAKLLSGHQDGDSTTICCAGAGDVSVNCICANCIDVQRIWPVPKGETKAEDSVVDFFQQPSALRPGEFAETERVMGTMR